MKVIFVDSWMNNQLASFLINHQKFVNQPFGQEMLFKKL